MKKKRLTLIGLGFITLMFFSLTGCGSKEKTPEVNPDGKLQVYTSFYLMEDFAKKIGGERAEVTNMVPDGMEPHDWEPAAYDLTGLSSADVFIYNGLGLEHWVDKVLKTLSRDDLLVVEAGGEIVDKNITGGNSLDPHIWLNPLYAKAQLSNVKTALIQADPQGAQYYEENFQRYAALCEALDERYRTALSALTKRDLVVTHAAFGYLCSAYGLRQMPLSGLEPDAEPSPATMAQVIEFIKANGVTVIFYEEMIDPKVAEAIARETGVQTEVLSPLEGLSEAQRAAGDDYFSVMEQNLAAIQRALQ